MIHVMHVVDGQFWKIVDGTKTIEVRLLDEKRKQIQLGDEIEFINKKDAEKHVKASVVGLSQFKTLQALFQALPCDKLGSPCCELDAQIESIKKFYTEEEIKTHSALAIHIRRIA